MFWGLKHAIATKKFFSQTISFSREKRQRIKLYKIIFGCYKMVCAFLNETCNRCVHRWKMGTWLFELQPEKMICSRAPKCVFSSVSRLHAENWKKIHNWFGLQLNTNKVQLSTNNQSSTLFIAQLCFALIYQEKVLLPDIIIITIVGLCANRSNTLHPGEHNLMILSIKLHLI